MRRSTWPFWLLLAIAAIAIPASAQLFNLARFGTVRAFEAVFDNNGNPWPFTSLVPAINYDLGGQGIGFGAVARTDNPNCQINASTYRADYFNFKTSTWAAQSSVPYNICGSLAPGDFHNYTTSVTGAGPFNITLYTANAVAGANWNVLIDNSSVATVTLPGSGDFSTVQPTQSSNFNISQGTHILKIVGASGDPTNNFIGDFAGWQGALAQSGSCVNSGANLCFLYGGFLGGIATSPWVNGINRFLDFTDNFINQDMCNRPNGDANYPFNQGYEIPDTTRGNSLTGYQAAISGSAPCSSRMYYARTQNEWWLNCTAMNPFYNGSTCPPNEAAGAVTDPNTWMSRVCSMYSAMRSAIPNIKIDFYAPVTVAEQAYDPVRQGMCSFDFYELHLYVDAGNYGGLTGSQVWATNDFCGVAPPSISCTGSSRLGMLAAESAQFNKPIISDEWCSAGFNDTASPDGTDMGAYMIIKWFKANNVVSTSYWHDVDADNCDPNLQPNVRQALINGLGSTHYAGTTFTPIPLPTPNPWFP